MRILDTLIIEFAVRVLHCRRRRRHRRRLLSLPRSPPCRRRLSRINEGGLQLETVDLMGDLMLVGIAKPDGGTRGWYGDFKRSQPRVIDSSTYQDTP